MLLDLDFENFTFGEKGKQILKEQIITETIPGSILQDVKILMDYISSHTIYATKKNKLIAIKHLSIINDQLTHPVKLKLERPQQKAFPNINGLYLLLRSLGIIKFIKSGKNHIIKLDDEIVRIWNNLNNIERYFTLLEIWLIRTNPKEIIGETIIMAPNLLKECTRFCNRIPAKGLKISGDKKVEFFITFSPGLYNIALLQLFGFLNIQQGKQAKVWHILKVKQTDFGDAILRFLFNSKITNDIFLDFKDYYKVPLGLWQTELQPFFPEWRNNMIFPVPELRKGNHIFKVSWEGIWRRIEIDGKMTLEDLTDIILDAFNFDKDHLYEYTYFNRFGHTIEIYRPEANINPFTTEIKIGEIPIQPGEAIEFLYDFGDNWNFDILLEKIIPSDKKLKLSLIIEEYGESPEQYPKWDDDPWYDDFIF